MKEGAPPAKPPKSEDVRSWLIAKCPHEIKLALDYCEPADMMAIADVYARVASSLRHVADNPLDWWARA